MIFTARTYRVTIRRASKLEYRLFSEHASCFRGPEAWIKQKDLTNRLNARKRRERYPSRMW